MIDERNEASDEMRIGRGNHSTRKKLALVSLCPSQISNEKCIDYTTFNT
jgi:hypothetical protein